MLVKICFSDKKYGIERLQIYRLWISQNSVEFHIIYAELLQLKNERKLHID